MSRNDFGLIEEAIDESIEQFFVSLGERFPEATILYSRRILPFGQMRAAMFACAKDWVKDFRGGK